MDTHKKELKQERRKKLIAALIHGKIEAAESIRKEITGEKVIINNFLDLLIFTSNSDTDNRQIEFAPGPFKDFLMTITNNQNGELKPSPVWSIPVDSLTDEEIELYMKQDSGKLL